jgi:acetate---CoA ligase (ADP-forming)
MFDVAALLANQPISESGRVAIVTNAGGPGILAADACEANGLTVVALTSATTSALRAFLPVAASVTNPVDMIASASADDYRRTIEAVLADPNVDSLLTIFIPPIVTVAEEVAKAIQTAAAGSRKPVLATFMGVQNTLAVGNIPTYLFPESAAVALAHVTEYSQWRRQPVAAAPHLTEFKRDTVRAVVTGALASGGGWLDPAQTNDLLKAAGIRVADARVARTATEAEQIAAAIGFPVVMKGLGSTLLHKTEADAATLGLKDVSGVRDAFVDLQSRLGGRLDGVLVQRRVSDGVEMVVGGLNDRLLGPVIMAGTGGVFVELFGDTAFRMCPLSETEATALIED